MQMSVCECCLINAFSVLSSHVSWYLFLCKLVVLCAFVCVCGVYDITESLLQAELCCKLLRSPKCRTLNIHKSRKISSLLLNAKSIMEELQGGIWKFVSECSPYYFEVLLSSRKWYLNTPYPSAVLQHYFRLWLCLFWYPVIMIIT